MMMIMMMLILQSKLGGGRGVEWGESRIVFMQCWKQKAVFLMQKGCSSKLCAIERSRSRHSVE